MKHLLLTTIAAVVLVGCGQDRRKNQEWVNDNIFGLLPTWGWVSIMAGVVLLSWGKYLQSKRSIKGAIHNAARTGDIKIVKQALNYGADVNAVSLHGGTLLHHAALNNHKPVVQLLVAKGADINAKAAVGGTPLDRAAGEIADLIRKHGGKTGEELKAEEK